MLKIKKAISTLCMCTIVVSLGNFSFALEKEYLNMNQIVDKAIESNANIRSLDSKVTALNEGVRRAKSGADISALMHKKYREFRYMWNSDEKEFDHLKDLNSSQTLEIIKNLSIKLSSTRNPQSAGRYVEELKFLEYTMIFGNDEPELTDAELYSKFIKNAELLTLQQENSRDKTLVNKLVIEGNVRKSAVSLFVLAKNIEQGIELQNEMLMLRRRILSELNDMYDQGLVSKVQLELNQLEVDKLEHEIKKLEINLKKLDVNIKNMVGLGVLDELVLTTMPSKITKITNNPISEYVDQAIESNTKLYALKLDFDYAEKNKKLFDKYVKLDFGQEYETLADNLYRLEIEIKTLEKRVESNTFEAYADIIYNEHVVKQKLQNQKNKADSFVDAKQKLELGLMKRTDVQQLEIAYKASVNEYLTALKNMENAKVRFGLLLDFGIEY